jgi:hypothetical protein
MQFSSALDHSPEMGRQNLISRFDRQPGARRLKQIALAIINGPTLWAAFSDCAGMAEPMGNNECEE